jgi:hypothetical protein
MRACYSYLRASTGFNLDACLAGRYPEASPIKNEKAKHPKIK